MTEERQMQRDRMLAAYGARIGRWPAGRANGVVGLAVSADFRRRYRAERQLDRDLAMATRRRVDGDRLERRLLAAMGVAEPAVAPSPTWGQAAAVSLAAASLCLGIAVGGFYGETALGPAVYAGLSDSAWAAIVEDELSEEAG